MTQSPHPTPLFPYTTLFRSEQPSSLPKKLLGVCRAPARQSIKNPLRRLPDRRQRFEQRPERDSVAIVKAAPVEHPSVVAEDRKSTRLNSSHSSISYAVFCLK